MDSTLFTTCHLLSKRCKKASVRENAAKLNEFNASDASFALPAIPETGFARCAHAKKQMKTQKDGW